MRTGSAQAMIGAGLLIQQAPFLIPMPYSAGVVLLAVSLLLLVTAAGSFALFRR